ncbi:MAG: hypothetical protein Q7J45_00245 [bacterium]|nr:hypothetical protein [bacterium]
MSEKLPANPDESLLERSFREYQEQKAAGEELLRQDAEDSERGPIGQAVRFAVIEAGKRNVGKDSPYEGLVAFRAAFMEHFGNQGARRYRLFHVLVGSTPPPTSDLFDAEGEWSIAKAMQNLVQKYSLGEVDAEAA